MLAAAFGVLVSATGCRADVSPHPPSPPAASKPTPAAPTGQVRPRHDGVDVRYTLEAPVREVRFADTGNVRTRWSVLEASLRMDGDVIVGSTPFTEFTVRIRPDEEPYDRVYPSLTAVGEGFALFGPALSLQGQDVEFSVAPAHGRAVLPAADTFAGYLFVGPADEASTTGEVGVVGSRNVAPAVAAAVVREVDVSLGFYRDMLGTSVATPTIIVSDQVPGLEGASHHGDVTANDVMFLRFGKQFAESDDADDAVASFLRHESFHLWNRSFGPGSPPWLHEGAAEYASILAVAHAGISTPERTFSRLDHNLTQCREALGEQPFSQLSNRGSALYECGVAVQWIADLEARASDALPNGFFELWRELVARQPYDESDFRALTGPLVADFLDAPHGRWQGLEERLRPLGVEFSREPSDAQWREATLRHVMSQVCRSAGWWTEDGYVRLDTGEGCQGLPPQPEVIAMEGKALFGAAESAFSAVARRCKAGAAVRLGTRDGDVVRVPCRAPAPPPAVLHLVHAPRPSPTPTEE